MGMRKILEWEGRKSSSQTALAAKHRAGNTNPGAGENLGARPALGPKEKSMSGKTRTFCALWHLGQ
jgi:hypothetical protein